MNKKSKFRIYKSGESILFAVLFLVLGIILITNSQKAVLYTTGAFALIIGVFKLLLYYKLPENVEDKSEYKKTLLSGMFFLTFGSAVVVSTSVVFSTVVNVLFLILSIYFLYAGIYQTVRAFKVKKQKRMPYLIVAGVVFLFGILLLILRNDMPTIITGIFLILYAITEIFYFVIAKEEKPVRDVVKEVEIIKAEDVKLIEKKEK